MKRANRVPASEWLESTQRKRAAEVHEGDGLRNPLARMRQALSNRDYGVVGYGQKNDRSGRRAKAPDQSLDASPGGPQLGRMTGCC